MRPFTDEQGVDWVASVAAEQGGDYKGRYYLILRRPGAEGEEPVALVDVRRLEHGERPPWQTVPGE